MRIRRLLSLRPGDVERHFIENHKPDLSTPFSCLDQAPQFHGVHALRQELELVFICRYRGHIHQISGPCPVLFWSGLEHDALDLGGMWFEHDLRADHRKAVAAPQAIGDADQIVGGFGGGIGDAVIEVGENVGCPVPDGGSELPKGRHQLWVQGALPILPALLRLTAIRGVIQGIERLPRPIGFLEQRMVLKPQGQPEHLRGGEGGFPLAHGPGIAQQPAPLILRQRLADVLADPVQRKIREPQNMELVHHDGGSRQRRLNRLPIGQPHVHCHAPDALRVRQGLEKPDHRRFVPVREQVEDVACFQVGKHSA